MHTQSYAWRRQSDAGACQTCPDAMGHNRGDEPTPAWAAVERSLPPAWSRRTESPATRRARAHLLPSKVLA
jgi:hypothetical protein